MFHPEKEGRVHRIFTVKNLSKKEVQMVVMVVEAAMFI
jgi:hypothetical protein